MRRLRRGTAEHQAEVQRARLAGHGAILRDPVMVELVGLMPSAWRQHGISAQVKPEEVEDAAGYAGRIGCQMFIGHEVRLDLEYGEPGPPGWVVFVDGLDQGVDLLEVATVS
jgi:hypothetical protein